MKGNACSHFTSDQASLSLLSLIKCFSVSLFCCRQKQEVIGRVSRPTGRLLQLTNTSSFLTAPAKARQIFAFCPESGELSLLQEHVCSHVGKHGTGCYFCPCRREGAPQLFFREILQK
ncbi:hypothetical protein ATANTOWER_021045 [Ataeniobius toweri]|uniref:Secreted protein n=1 Tax=Ataeniobius toweri TaxID=208326 RepID=A0ABU7AQM7_9TELE|nr:hypothetical protein [Ataeniobius toweri]